MNIEVTEIQQLWATPFMRARVNSEQFLDQLLNEILVDPDASSSDAAVLTRATIEHKVASGDPLFIASEHFIRQTVDVFFKRFYGLVGVKYRVEQFYLLHPQGKHVNYHNHRGSTLTGVLYVNIPSGHITLHDPRTNANRGMMAEMVKTGCFDPVSMLPERGDLLCFPSYVYHVGSPNLTPEPRVVLTFDIMAPKSHG